MNVAQSWAALVNQLQEFHMSVKHFVRLLGLVSLALIISMALVIFAQSAEIKTTPLAAPASFADVLAPWDSVVLGG